jgi:hypothetical protein
VTLAQAAALRQLPHFRVVDGSGGSSLIVRGANGLYWMSPGGLLTPIRESGRLLLEQRSPGA